MNSEALSVKWEQQRSNDKIVKYNKSLQPRFFAIFAEFVEFESLSGKWDKPKSNDK